MTDSESSPPEANPSLIGAEMLPLDSLAFRFSEDRGNADHGWLKSRHTFSFGNYYDPRHSGFRCLRVINEDRVAPRGGFPAHPHRDMEIFSYVVSGTLEHQDSMGNKARIHPGQIQIMSAGAGIVHSEFNPSDSEPVHFLQIWIEPNRKGLEPGYNEWSPSSESENEGKTLLISSDGRGASAKINQDAQVYRIQLSKGEEVKQFNPSGRGLWLQMIRGMVEVSGRQLNAGDAVATEAEGQVGILALADTEALLFDLP